MSWHSGDWANFSIAFTSAVAAISAAVAAFKSKKTSDAALQLQKEIIKSERNRNLRLSLKEAAKEANNAAGGLPPNEWDFNRVSSICTSINSARRELLSESTGLSEAEIDEFKMVFMDYLSTSISWELQQTKTPSSLYNNVKGSIMPPSKSLGMWSRNREFFVLPDE